jgi:hypothetical protein
MDFGRAAGPVRGHIPIWRSKRGAATDLRTEKNRGFLRCLRNGGAMEKKAALGKVRNITALRLYGIPLAD